MKPIKRGLLPHIVTIYNIFKDPKTGKLSYFRTFLEYVRIMTERRSVNVTGIGWTRVLASDLWIDPVSSVAYVRDEDGNKVTKIYVELREWLKLSEGQKEAHWTLQEGDYVVRDECQITLPPNTIAELNAEQPHKLQMIEPILDKPGNIHHWEIGLV